MSTRCDWEGRYSSFHLQMKRMGVQAKLFSLTMHAVPEGLRDALWPVWPCDWHYQCAHSRQRSWSPGGLTLWLKISHIFRTEILEYFRMYSKGIPYSVWGYGFGTDQYYDKCKKNCSLSTTYNGKMTHGKQ